MVKFLAKALLAAGLAVSVGANAATYDLGTLPSGLTDFTPSPVTGSFSDTIDFTLSGLSNVSSTLGSLTFSLGPTQVFGITGLSLSVYNSANTLLGSGASVTLSNLASGSYYAIVTGKTTGAAGGEYAGAFNVSPVPEASTWAMMLLGLGVLGYTASRRKV